MHFSRLILDIHGTFFEIYMNLSMQKKIQTSRLFKFSSDSETGAPVPSSGVRVPEGFFRDTRIGSKPAFTNFEEPTIAELNFSSTIFLNQKN